MSEVGGGGMKKKPLDIIDHMTEHLQSYEGRYLVLGPGSNGRSWGAAAAAATGGLYYPQYLLQTQPGFIYPPPQSSPNHPLLHTYYRGGESGGCLIENMVGNWSPDLSGTYSPFGGGVGQPPPSPTSQHQQPQQQQPSSAAPASPAHGVSHLPPSHPQQPKKQRIVAEVKPLRPSYSDVLAKSPPPLSPASKQPPMKTQQPTQPSPSQPVKPTLVTSPTVDQHQPARQRQNKSAPTTPTCNSQQGKSDVKRENSVEDTDLKKHKKLDTEVKPNDLLSKKQKKNKQPNKQTGKEEKSSCRNKTQKSDQQQQSSNYHLSGEYRKYCQVSEEESDGYCETTSRRDTTIPSRKQTGKGERNGVQSARISSKSKRSQRGYKRKETKLGLLWRKWQEKCWHYAVLSATWLINLLVDVTAMSAALLLQLGGVVCSTGYDICNSGWVWMKQRYAAQSPPVHQTASSSESSTCLQHNIQLPTTGEEAMKRLLSCKGKDPYSILGLTNTCTDEEIRRYYRSQALLVHPDKNSQPGAEEAFKILVHAFDLIAEPEKRGAYDRYVAETNQVEQAWSELSDLLSQLHEKMHYAATTIRCNNCGKRHKRVLTDRPVYAARLCAECNIHHSAKEGDMWCEWGNWLWSRRYLACMEGCVYEITDWAKCQGGRLTDLQPHSHLVHYRVLLGGVHNSHPTDNQQGGEPDFDDLLSSLYGNQGGGRNHRPSSSRSNKKNKKTK